MLPILTKFSLLVALCSGQSLIDHGHHTHHDMLKGKCPVLNDTISARKDKFQPQKLLGIWKTMYESKERTHNMDCLTVKFQEFPGANSSQMQVLIGHQLVDPENDISRFEDVEMDGVFYDEAYLSFGNPYDQGEAAIFKTKEDLQTPPMELIMRDAMPLTKEQMKKMTHEEIRLHSEHADLLMRLDADELEQLNDPFEHSWQILETDYDQYFISYMCHELEENINSADQTEDEVWQLKQKKPNLSYDEHFTSQTFHYVIAGIHVRNMSRIHPMQLRQYMLRLEKMVPGHDFHASRHDMIYHGYKCPHESEDLFTQPFVHSYKQMIDNMDDDGKVHYHHTYELVRNHTKQDPNVTNDTIEHHQEL